MSAVMSRPASDFYTSNDTRSVDELDAAIGRGLDGAVQGAFEIGPVSRALDGQPEELRRAAAASIREALTPFAKGDAVLLPASVWIVTARAS